jgi:hypothetical protein
MKFKFNKINDIALFHNLNQWDEVWSKMCCTYFGPAANLKYNCWIDISESDIKGIALKKEKEWKFSFKNGWRGSDWIEAILEFVKENALERWYKVPNLAIFKKEDEVELFDWINRGYAAVIWIKVNKEFYKDSRDGSIDIKDYANLVWWIGHFNCIAKWISRGETNTEEHHKDMFIDNYMEKNSTYKCDIKEVLEDLSMNTKYIFF